MKKKLLAFVLAATVLMSACTGGAPAAPSDSAAPSASGSTTAPAADGQAASDISGTVRVLLAGFELEDGIDPVTMAEYKGLKTFWDETFTPKYPNIKVEFTSVPWNNAQQKQQAELAAGNVDVLYTGSYVNQFYEQGLLRDIDDLLAKDTAYDPLKIFPNGIFKTSYSMVSADGKQFGLPAVMGQRYTIMDTKLFDDWGVEYLSEKPTTEEIIEKAAKMTGKNPKTGEQNYGIWFDTTFPTDVFTFASWAYAFNADGGTGHPAKPGEIKWNLNGKEMYNLFDSYGRMVKSAIPGFVTGNGKEKLGQENNDVAIFLDWQGSNIVKAYLDSKDDSMIKRFKPVMNVGPDGEGWVACDPIVMSAKTKDVDAAWEVMKHLAGQERQEYSYKNFRWTPALASTNCIDDFDIYTKVALEVAKNAKYTLVDEANPFYCSEITPVVTKYHSDVIAGKDVPIQPILDTLQKKAEEWSRANSK